ncbi:MAG: tripartite tricarboxylate transporter TctB family protein [Gemmatimonadota bacterium]
MTASTRADRVTGLVLILLGLAVGAQAMTFDVLFLTDPVGPKALPLLSAAVFVLSGVLLLLRPGSAGRWPERPVLLRMAGAVLAFLVYAALLAPLGFVVATTITVTALSLLFDGPWLKSLGAATALSAVLWYLFVWALDLQLPLGRVWEALWMG